MCENVKGSLVRPPWAEDPSYCQTWTIPGWSECWKEMETGGKYCNTVKCPVLVLTVLVLCSFYRMEGFRKHEVVTKYN